MGLLRPLINIHKDDVVFTKAPDKSGTSFSDLNSTTLRASHTFSFSALLKGTFQ
jgi:hypothetical protein